MRNSTWMVQTTKSSPAQTDTQTRPLKDIACCLANGAATKADKNAENNAV
jgi:hypothetical protein